MKTPVIREWDCVSDRDTPAVKSMYGHHVDTMSGNASSGRSPGKTRTLK
ncbi:MAG: hypothetical protein J0I76_12975 [Thiobacillus sp.]|nr:hypothetical protein [Thiobacillus sp.]